MTRMHRLLAPVAARVAGACASAPPAPPPPPAFTFERKMGWILRLEDARILRDPEPLPLRPRRRARAAAGARRSSGRPPVHPDLVALLDEADPRLRRRAAIAIGRVGLAEGVEPLLARLDEAGPGRPDHGGVLARTTR